MNRYNFQQTGGFPLETDTLNNMQIAYSIFNALGEISGEKTIVTGCIEAAGIISNGVVYLNGELLEFRGGAVQTHVRIIETPSSKEFEDGSYNEVHYERYVTFSSGVEEIPWFEFTRLISISEIQKRLVPIGVINMWSGSINEIPQGWALCDGTNGTPNLSGRFVVGYNSADADYNTIGNAGGLNKVTLTQSQMPSHSHLVNDYYMLESSMSGAIDGADILPSNARGTSSTDTDNKYLLYKTHASKETGGNQPHENRPPYYTLAFIKHIGY